MVDPFMDKTVAGETGAKQKSWPKLIRKIGIVLYLFALLAPPHWNFSNDFHVGGGLMALIQTPVWACVAIANGIQERYWRECLLGISMIVGWASNFYIFFRMPVVMAVFAIASPWILYIGVTFLDSTIGFSTSAIDYIPFYPWAVSLALIHISRLAEPKSKEEIRSIWTGF